MTFRLPLHYDYQETRYGYAQVCTVVTGYRLSGCSALQGRQPRRPATDHPQEIQRNQTAGLQKMGTVSVLMYGSPMDVEAALKAKQKRLKRITTSSS
jgi:hypothetical protein